MKNLAVAGAERDPVNPDIPTFAEAGIGEIDITGPMCLFAPTGTPDEALAALEVAVQDIAGIKGYGRFMSKNNLAAFHISRADAEAKFETMYEVFTPLVEKTLGRK